MTIDEMIANGASLDAVLAAAKSRINTRDRCAAKEKELIAAREAAAQAMVKYMQLLGVTEENYDWHEMAKIMEESEPDLKKNKARSDHALRALDKIKDMSLDEMLAELKNFSESLYK